MKTLELAKFGKTLTDREYGKTIGQTIVTDGVFPLVLDFKGVISLGSSCGDEILTAVGRMQGSEIQITNTNQPIRFCLEKVAEDLHLKVIFL
jgi:hypothetical protein